MKQKLFIYTIIVLLLSSCNVYKTQRLITGGTLSQTNFFKKIEYQSFRNWIIIEAKINGSPKTYKFLFDTGAVSVVSSKMVEELNLKKKAHQSVGSSNTKRQRTAFTELKSVDIAGINFENIGAVILDFDTSPEISCLGAEIDGIIGANLMKLAVWQIDYQKNLLTFSDEENQLGIQENYYSIPFTPSKQGSPKVWLPLFGKKVKVTFDTGKLGGIGVNQKQLSSVDFESDSVATLKGYGRAGAGIFGAEQDTNYLAAVYDFKLNDLHLDTVLINVGKKTGSLAGNGFLENYKVTFNWQSNIIKLEPVQDEQPATIFESFGFGYTLKDEKLLISYIFENSPIEKAGVLLNSQILEINDEAFEKVSLDEFCELRSRNWSDEEIENLTLKYKTPDLKEQTIELSKTRLL